MTSTVDVAVVSGLEMLSLSKKRVKAILKDRGIDLWKSGQVEPHGEMDAYCIRNTYSGSRVIDLLAGDGNHDCRKKREHKEKMERKEGKKALRRMHWELTEALRDQPWVWIGSGYSRKPRKGEGQGLAELVEDRLHGLDSFYPGD